METADWRDGLKVWWKRAYRVSPYGVRYSTWAVRLPILDDGVARLTLDERTGQETWRAEGRVHGQTVHVVGVGNTALAALDRLVDAVQRCLNVPEDVDGGT